MWCGKCYTPHPGDPFPVKRPVDDDNVLQLDAKDREQFLEGRDGDHLMTAFQCDLCHFRNIKKRNPRPGRFQDDTMMLYIRRANLDALWAREPNTVN